jgi:hypothetical protein
MRFGVLAAFAVAMSVSALADVSPVQLESAVPSITITYSGQGSDPTIGPYYRFAVRNNSSHGVTGFHVYQIPDSVQKVDGKYSCDASCASVALNGDISDPMIKPGATFDLRVPPKDAAKWPTILVDAAVFDNYTYEGDEKIASRLGLAQIANQAAFDAMKPLLDGVVKEIDNTDSGKAEELRSQLHTITLNVEPEMVQRFNYWFPNMPDCGHDLSRLMQSTGDAAVRVVERDLEKYISGAAGGGMSFSSWIASVNDYMHTGHIGCAGCSVVPSGASAASTEFLPCPAQPGSASTPSNSP